LTDQPRTRAELAGFLAARDVPDEVATRLLDRFTEVGLIDDASYARAWIRSRLAGRGLARRALAAELRRKGVPDEIAREALDEIDPDDEAAAAHRLVRRKLPGMARLAPEVRTRRLVAMLARKGFPAGLAFAVVREEAADLLDSCANRPSSALPSCSSPSRHGARSADTEAAVRMGTSW
jgi:regulatory protein